MSVLSNLSSALQRRDQIPNQELAKKIAATSDKNAVKELINCLPDKNKVLQGDCIKTLYEIGYIKPELISGYASEFIAQLESKNNRMQWGAMIALDTITTENPDLIFRSLGKIIKVAEKGSVITRDHYVNILIKLGVHKKYSEKVFPLLKEQLLTCPTNQLPMYAERAMPVVDEKNKTHILKCLTSRLDEMGSESKRKRVEKVIKKLSA